MQPFPLPLCLPHLGPPSLLLLTALPSLTSVPRRCLTKASTSAGAQLTLTLCGTGGDPTQALPLQTFYFTP